MNTSRVLNRQAVLARQVLHILAIDREVDRRNQSGSRGL
jgi:hypothetical protein